MCTESLDLSPAPDPHSLRHQHKDDLMINTHRLLKLFLDLVRLDSPSLGEKPVADYIRYLLQGYDLFIDDAGKALGGSTGNVIVRVPATGPGQAMIISAHMDCVPPCLGVVPVVQDGVIRSAGATVLGGDDKAGIAAILEALLHLEEEQLPHPELYLVFTICEEEGLRGAALVDYARIGAREAVVLDAGGPVGAVIVRSPSKAGMTMTFHGRAVHAGIEPENGVNAIVIAANAVSRMRLLRIDEETVANLGRIEGGGQTNIVPDCVLLTGEARSQSPAKLQAHIEHMRACCAQAVAQCGGSFDFEYEITYPGLDVSPDSPLVLRAQDACARLGLPFAAIATGGGSDANIFAGHGIECINLAIGMSKVHTTEEFITVESLLQTTQLTAALMHK